MLLHLYMVSTPKKKLVPFGIQDMNKRILKPCPFCEGLPILNISLAYNMQPFYSVQCTRCKVALPISDDKDSEILKWNTRPLEDKQFWEGFDACLEMVLNHIDNEFITTSPVYLKDSIIEAAELYKTDG